MSPAYNLTSPPSLTSFPKIKIDKLLHSIFNNTADFIYVLDTNYRLTLFNNAFAHFFIKMYRTDLYIGKNMIKSLLPTNWQLFYNKALIGTSVEQTLLWSLPKQQEIYVLAHFTPIYADDNKVVACTIHLKDVTQQHQKVNALQQKIEQYQLLFQNIPENILIYDICKNKVLSVNEKMQHYLNYNKQDFIDTPLPHFMPNQQVNQQSSIVAWENLINKSSRQGVQDLQWLWKKRNGDVLHTDATYIILPYPQQNILVGVFRDITQKKALEKKQRQVYQEQKIILDAIPAFFLHKDLKNNIIKCNKTVAHFLNHAVTELEGKNLWDVAPTLAERITEGDDYVLEMGQPLLNQIESYQFKGRKRWVRIDRTPYFNQAGKVTGLLFYAIDLTPLKNTQQALENKNRQLQKYIDSNLELENFAYVASHDLKEPLRTLGGFAQLLKIRYAEKLDQEGNEFLSYIISATQQMNQLISDLLAYSKVNTQQHVVEEVNFDEFINNIIQLLHHSIQDKHAVIQLGQLPSVIYGNSTKLKQLFQNLMANAIKFRHPDREPVIDLRCQEKANCWQFSIADNGIGISKEYYEKIFLLFKKLHHKLEYEGTGIGLALCQKIVTQHGGEIWVESALNKGTTFFFTIHKDGR